MQSLDFLRKWTTKSTNDRSKWIAIVLLVMFGALGTVLAGSPGHREAALEFSHRTYGSASARESDLRWLNRLHSEMLDVGTPIDHRQFIFSFVALAREYGIPVQFVAVDAATRTSIRGSNLAVGIGPIDRMVIFDSERVRRPAPWRLQRLSDQKAAAILIGEIGVARLMENDLQGASQQFHLAVDLDPELAWAWSGLGEVMRRQGETESAMDAYQKSLELASMRTW